MLQVVLEHTDEAHGQCDRRIPVGVDDTVELAVGEITDEQWRHEVGPDWVATPGEVITEALALVRTARQQCFVALLTNATTRLEADLALLGLDAEVDAVFNSSRLGIAKHLEALQQTDHAIEQLQAIVASKPTAPFSSLAFAYLRLGQAYDRMGHRTQAMSAYRSAAAAAPAAVHRSPVSRPRPRSGGRRRPRSGRRTRSR